MKIKLILTAAAVLFTMVSLWSQGAGNYMYNQKISKGYSNNMDIATDGIDYQYNNTAQQSRYTTYNPYINYGVNDTVIYLQTRALMNVKADRFILIFGVSQIGETVEGTHDVINSRIQNFIKSMESYGITPNDIHIDFISQSPIFAYEVEKKLFSKTYNEIPKGFEVKKNIHVLYNDIRVADKLLIEAAKNEIYDIIKVEYLIDDMEAVYDTLRKESVSLLNKKVKDFETAGVKMLPMYQSVEETIYSTQPLDRYSSYEPFNKSSLKALNKTDESLISSNRDINIYYNRLPYSNYEIVIHPEVVEPGVQFVYYTKLKCVLKKQ